jgi:hypothetical protein
MRYLENFSTEWHLLLVPDSNLTKDFLERAHAFIKNLEQTRTNER